MNPRNISATGLANQIMNFVALLGIPTSQSQNVLLNTVAAIKASPREQGWIEKTILSAVEPYGFRVSVTVPAADTTLTNAEVATLGTVTATSVHLVSDP